MSECEHFQIIQPNRIWKYYSKQYMRAIYNLLCRIVRITFVEWTNEHVSKIFTKWNKNIILYLQIGPVNQNKCN